LDDAPEDEFLAKRCGNGNARDNHRQVERSLVLKQPAGIKLFSDSFGYQRLLGVLERHDRSEKVRCTEREAEKRSNQVGPARSYKVERGSAREAQYDPPCSQECENFRKPHPKSDIQ
jgi:hypothetical protein